MKWYKALKQLFSPAAPTPPAPEPERRIQPDYRDPVYLKLADRCAMGDIAAMPELARWHRQFAHPEGEALLAAYEQDPEAWQGLEQWFYQHRYGGDAFHLRCCITWICRAALYGNPEAEAQVRRCSRFPSWSLLPESIYGSAPAVRFPSSRHFYSYELHRLGLRDIDEHLEEFSLYPLTKDGIFPAYYLYDYIPADSDGFGREDDYRDLYYDEFFNRLPGRKYSQALEALAAMKKKREDYWSDPAHDREHRMYKRLLTDGEDTP